MQNKALRFALIIPPTGKYRRDERCQSEVEGQTAVVYLPPVDLALYAAILKSPGAVVKIFDFAVKGTTMSDSLEELAGYCPDICFFTMTIPTEKEDYAYLLKLKEKTSSKIWIKGGRATFESKKLLSDYPEIDLVFTGEPESALLVMKKNGFCPDESIPGITWKKEQIISTENQFITELSTLPHPDRAQLDNNAYLNPATRNVMTVIHAHRGCPSQCIFCPAPIVEGRKVRFRKVDDLLNEIEDCVKMYHITDFLFNGDTFTIRKSWIIELCQGIIDRGLEIQWGCNSRVDTIDEEMAAIMKKAGCWIVGFGIESGSNDMLTKMKKNTTTQQAERAVSACQKHKLKVHTFYILGLPWESEETLKQTLAFAKKIKADFFDFNLAYPLPGTPYYQLALKNKLLVADDLSAGSYSTSIVNTLNLSHRELIKWRKKILLTLYLQPSYIYKTFRFILARGNYTYYLKYAWKRMMNITGGL